MINEEQLETRLKLLDELQSPCTYCGICLEACSTYQASGWEHNSPRGRIRLAHELMNGHIHPNSKALKTFDECLGCHACEKTCPVQVKFGRIRQLVQDIRFQLAPESNQIHTKWIQMAYRMGSFFWRHFVWRWFLPAAFTNTSQSSYLKKNGTNQIDSEDIVLCVSCVQDGWNHALIQDTVSLLKKLGGKVHLSSFQPCCGAIFERLKEDPKASIWQKKREKAFMQWLPTKTFFLSMACQCHVKRLGGSVLDLYEWIYEKIETSQYRMEMNEPSDLYYQPYCGQDKMLLQDPIWRLLNRIENARVQLVPFPFSCCGGYCGESVVNPEAAKKWIEPKRLGLPSNALIVVASPDCEGQFLLHGESQWQIKHPIEIINKAFRECSVKC